MLAPVGSSGHEKCTICFDDIAPNEQLNTRCNHAFHRACLETWLSTKNTCPNCRLEAPNPNFVPVQSVSMPRQINAAPLTNLLSSLTELAQAYQELERLNSVSTPFIRSESIRPEPSFYSPSVVESRSTPFIRSESIRPERFALHPPSFYSPSVVESRSHPRMRVYQRMQGVIDLIQGSHIDRALTEVRDFGTYDYSISQRRSGTISTVGNISYHLFQIHSKESPERLREDFEYGFNAFFNLNGCSAENSERIRCIQRIMVEQAVGDLKLYLNQGYYPPVREFLDLLESLQLHENDCPSGYNNIAHYLYGEFYQMNLHDGVNVADPIYDNDFGRLVFRMERGDSTGRFTEFRKQVVEKLQAALADAWFAPSNNTTTTTTTTTYPTIISGPPATFTPDCFSEAPPRRVSLDEMRIQKINRLSGSLTLEERRDAYNDLDSEMKNYLKSEIWALNNQRDIYLGVDRSSFWDSEEGFGIGAFIVVCEPCSRLFSMAVNHLRQHYVSKQNEHRIQKIHWISQSITEEGKRRVYNNFDNDMKNKLKAAIWRLNNQSDMYEGVDRSSFWNSTEGQGIGAYIVTDGLQSRLFNVALRDLEQYYIWNRQ